MSYKLFEFIGYCCWVIVEGYILLDSMYGSDL